MNRASVTSVDLIVGIRGDFRSRARRVDAASVGSVLPHTLERWGITPQPWRLCDSGADLDTAGANVLRGWNHVALERTGGPIRDLPISALMRTTWDGLELFGTLMLTGVDAIVPPDYSVSAMLERLAASTVRDSDRQVLPAPMILVEAGRAWPTSPVILWNPSALLEAMSELVDVDNTGAESLPRAEYLSTDAPSPFASSDENPFRAQVVLRDWTVDDAAWLAEVVAVSCRRVGIRQDVQVAVRLL